MNILDILKSIEQAIYEIALWVILIPKTIFHILRRPGEVPAYIQGELAKEDKHQFDDRMSPILLWLLLVVVPAYLLVKHFDPSLPQYLTKNPQNYVFYISSMLVSFLLVPALMMNRAAKKDFDRVSFKEAFYVQCYLQAPISFLGLMLLGIMKYFHYNFEAFTADSYKLFVNNINGWKDIFYLMIFGLVIFLGVLQVRLLMKYGKSIGGAIGQVCLCFFIIMFAMCITAAFGYVLFYGL